MKKGCVYFFKHIGLAPIKIGYTENISPIDRFTQFSTYAPYGGEILGSITTFEPNKLESLLHKKYNSKRLSGEWFDITKEDVERDIIFYSEKSNIDFRNNFEIQFYKKLEQNENENIESIFKNEYFDFIRKNINENIKFYTNDLYLTFIQKFQCKSFSKKLFIKLLREFANINNLHLINKSSNGRRFSIFYN